MDRQERGNAVPETALVISLVLLVLFGIIQFALISFAQISADGATFVAGQKDVALLGTAADQPSAQKIAASIFTQIAKSDLVAGQSTSGSALFETDVTKQLPTLQVPGFPATIPVQSRSVEPGVDPAGNGTTVLNFCAKGNSSPGNPAFFLPDTVDSATPSDPHNLVNNSAGAINTPALITNDPANPGHVEDLQAVADGLDLLQSSLEDVLTTLDQPPLPLLGALDPVQLLVRPALGFAFKTPITLLNLVPDGLIPTALEGKSSVLLNLLAVVSNILFGPTVLGAVIGQIIDPAVQQIVKTHLTNTDVPNIVKALTQITLAEQHLRALPSCP